MEPNKPITNPMLVGSIELLKAEDTQEHRNLFVSEMMKARFLTPVVLTPPPVPDGEGIVRIDPKCKVQFPMLSTPDGKQFLMAFTDGQELKKWQNVEKQPTFALGFDDYAGMLLSKDKEGNVNPAAGFVINPYGGNIVVTKDMVAALLMNKLQKSGKLVRPRAAAPKPSTAPATAEAVENAPESASQQSAAPEQAE